MRTVTKVALLAAFVGLSAFIVAGQRWPVDPFDGLVGSLDSFTHRPQLFQPRYQRCLSDVCKNWNCADTCRRRGYRMSICTCPSGPPTCRCELPLPKRRPTTRRPRRPSTPSPNPRCQHRNDVCDNCVNSCMRRRYILGSCTCPSGVPTCRCSLGPRPTRPPTRRRLRPPTTRPPPGARNRRCPRRMNCDSPWSRLIHPGCC